MMMDQLSVSCRSSSIVSGQSSSSQKTGSMADGRRRKKGEVDVTMSTLLEPAQMLQSELSLHEAARKNSKTELVKLLSAKVNVNSKNNLDRTALHWAAANGHIDLLEPLISAGADIEAEDKWLLPEDIDVLCDVTDKYGMRPILWAVWFGHEAVAKALIGAGVTVERANRQGMNLLHCAAHQNHASFIQYAHENLDSFPMNSVDKDDRTALHLAAKNGNLESVEKLIEYKCDLSLKDQSGQTAVHLASAGGHDEVLSRLLSAGVEVGDRDLNGYTALHLAAAHGHVKVAEALLSYNADCNAENVKEMTPLHVAAVNGQPDLIDLLVVHRSDMASQNYQGNTPLHLAVINKHPDCVQRLIMANSPLDIVNFRKMTALHEAVDLGLDDITEMLLVANANLSLQDKMGKTPLAIASRGSFTNLVDMLIKAERFRKCEAEEVVSESKTPTSSVQFKIPVHPGAPQMKDILYKLATKQLRPNEWKKMARYWKFSEDHIRALEHQYTGPQSYKEHGYRLLLIWLHGVRLDDNPLKGLFEGLEGIGRRELAEDIRKRCNIQADKRLSTQQGCLLS